MSGWKVHAPRALKRHIYGLYINDQVCLITRTKWLAHHNNGTRAVTAQINLLLDNIVGARWSKKPGIIEFLTFYLYQVMMIILVNSSGELFYRQKCMIVSAAVPTFQVKTTCNTNSNCISLDFDAVSCILILLLCTMAQRVTTTTRADWLARYFIISVSWLHRELWTSLENGNCYATISIFISWLALSKLRKMQKPAICLSKTD